MTNDEKKKMIANTLTPTNGAKDDGYYVYGLFDKSTKKPFYIGKGKGDRVFQHEREVDEEKKAFKEDLEKIDEQYKSLETDKEKEEYLESKWKVENETLSKKQEKIKELGDDGFETVIIKWGLKNKEAYMAESALINFYKFMWKKDGNEDKYSLTNIANGHASKLEKESRSPESKAWSADDFLKECAAEIINFNDIKVEKDKEILFIKINKLYPQCYEYKYRDWAIYESVRGSWKIGEENLDKIDFVCAIYRGQIVGIYPVNNDCWVKGISDDGKDFPAFPEETRSLEKETRLLINELNEPGKKLSFEELLKFLTERRDEKYRNNWKHTNKEIRDYILEIFCGLKRGEKGKYGADFKEKVFNDWIVKITNKNVIENGNKTTKKIESYTEFAEEFADKLNNGKNKDLWEKINKTVNDDNTFDKFIKLRDKDKGKNSNVSKSKYKKFENEYKMTEIYKYFEDTVLRDYSNRAFNNWKGRWYFSILKNNNINDYNKEHFNEYFNENLKDDLKEKCEKYNITLIDKNGNKETIKNYKDICDKLMYKVIKKYKDENSNEESKSQNSVFYRKYEKDDESNEE